MNGSATIRIDTSQLQAQIATLAAFVSSDPYRADDAMELLESMTVKDTLNFHQKATTKGIVLCVSFNSNFMRAMGVLN